MCPKQDTLFKNVYFGLILDLRQSTEVVQSCHTPFTQLPFLDQEIHTLLVTLLTRSDPLAQDTVCPGSHLLFSCYLSLVGDASFCLSLPSVTCPFSRVLEGRAGVWSDVPPVGTVTVSRDWTRVCTCGKNTTGSASTSLNWDACLMPVALPLVTCNRDTPGGGVIHLGQTGHKLGLSWGKVCTVIPRRPELWPGSGSDPRPAPGPLGLGVPVCV